ncbi:MAG: BamA/TamA family outer membrane protein [Puia sp.]|nr:BamA/TamA family outer membrane protein [Puia sp.]
MKIKTRIKFLLLFIGIVHCSFAQDRSVPDTIPPAPKEKGFFDFLAPHRAEAAKGKFLATPFVFPGYSPDIQYSLAAGAIFSFKTSPKDSLLPRSSVPITLTYSTIKAFIASSGWTTFWLHDHLRIYALIQYKLNTDAYYGVGYDNALHTAFPDSTHFRRSFFIFQVRPVWKIKKNFFAGVSLDWNQNVIWGINHHMAKDPYYLQSGSYILNTGIGGILTYDSRDVPQNPYRGIYSALIYTFYTPGLGGNQDFRALDFDNRFYLPLSHTKVRTLAINLRSRYDFGEVPFTSMISLGTSQDLRGFRFGQFRDYYMNYLIAEYRHKFYRGDKPTRFGFVLFSGIGSIGDDFGSGLFQRPLPDFGIGFRFEVQPRLNLRVDFGYAPSPTSHTASYFNFLESY